MTLINSYPQKTIREATDNLLVSEPSGAYKKILVGDFISGILTSSNIVTSGINADYKMDAGSGTTLANSSGSAANATINSAIWNADFDAGLDFGTSKYVTLPQAGLITSTTGFFVQALLNLNSYANYGRLCEFNTALESNSNSIAITTSSGTTGKPMLSVFAGAYTEITSNISLPLGKWIVLSANYTSNTGTLYFNNKTIASGSLPTIVSVVNRPISYLGRSAFASNSNLDGTIARISIYGRSLTKAERIQNFLAYKDYALSKGIVL